MYAYASVHVRACVCVRVSERKVTYMLTVQLTLAHGPSHRERLTSPVATLDLSSFNNATCCQKPKSSTSLCLSAPSQVRAFSTTH